MRIPTPIGRARSRWSLALAVIGSASAVAAQTPSPTAFVDVNVIPMDRERVVPHQTVVVRAGHVVGLGPVGRVTLPADARRIDGRGKYLIPGLGDMHTHLAYASGSDPDALLADSTSADSVRLASAERQLFVMLANGVTTVRDVDFRLPDENHPLIPVSLIRGPELLRLKARAGRGEILSPRIYTSANWQLDSTKSVDENLRLYRAAGYDHLKIYFENEATVDSIGRAARRYGVPIVGHGFEGLDGVARMATLGFKSMEHFAPYWKYLSDDTVGLQAIIDSVAKAGIWSSPTTGIPGFNPSATSPTPLEARYGAAELALELGRHNVDTGWVGVMTDTTRSTSVGSAITAQVAGWRRLVLGFQAKGPGLLLGTDAFFLTGPAGFMVHRGLQFFVYAGLTPYQALATGTVNVARYFGAEDSTGTVAVGKRADLVLLTGNPLENIRHTGDIAGVMIGGRWLSRAEIERRLRAYYRGRVAPFDTRAFVGVSVVPMDRERVLARHTVVVRDGRIVAMGPVGRVTIPADAIRIDGRGKFLIPGLADLHTHVMANPHPPRALVELLANGVTAIRNLDATGDARGHRPDFSPRMYTSGEWRREPGQSVGSSVAGYKQSGFDFLTLDTDHESAVAADSVAVAARESGIAVVRHGREARPVEHLAVPSAAPPSAGNGDSDAPAGPPAAIVHQGLDDLVRSGWTPYEALLAGTLHAAEFLGAQDSTGVVAVGKRADLVLLDGNPLTDIRHTRDIAGVMLGGRWMPRSLLQWRLQHYRARP